jgi:cytochrome oxidase Cu insertion factor (SCO1/SenC/PrrC family)
MSEPVKSVARRNRLLLLVLLASFVVPMLAGHFAYTGHWFEGGKTNRGHLIDPPVSLAGAALHDTAGKALPESALKGKWWLVYVLPEVCDASCRNRLFQMRQVRRATGKEADRVRQLVVQTGPLAPATAALLAQEFPDFLRAQADAAAVDGAFTTFAAGASRLGNLYIMDPMGWVMLAYAPEADEKASIVKGEDVLKDLLKLLKDSRIG